MKYIEYVYSGAQETTLQNFLRKNGISARFLKKLKRQENGITRNGILIRSVDMIKNGDVIRLCIDDERFLEPNPKLHADIAYENDYIAVFDKPDGMPVHPSLKHWGDTLGNYFAYLYPDLTFRPINRLDRNTSGLCAIAKNPHSANMLQGKIRKTYYAAVCGKTPKSGTVNAPIARECETLILRTVRDDGKPAVTHYRTLKQNDKYSLVEIELETGRTHQIRVHFAHIGFPLAGDELYGGSCEDISRHALHCGRLSFDDIFSGKQIIVNSPIRQDILDIVKGEI